MDVDLGDLDRFSRRDRPDGIDAPNRIREDPQAWTMLPEIISVWLDPAENVFHVYWTDAPGRSVLRKKPWLGQMLTFFGKDATLS